MVSVARIELALHAPKARVMPFHYTEKNWSSHYDSHVDKRWTLLTLKNDCIKIGAPRQNRTAITGLQNQCTTIVLVGLFKNVGSPAWDRTTDTLINSQVQLPLCYWGIKIGGVSWDRTRRARRRRIYSPLHHH